MLVAKKKNLVNMEVTYNLTGMSTLTTRDQLNHDQLVFSFHLSMQEIH